MIKASCDTIEEYINVLKTCALDEDLYVVKDPSCNFVYASDEIIKTFGFHNLSMLEGKNVYEINSRVVELAPMLHERDQKLVSKQENITMLVNFHAQPLGGFLVHEGAAIIANNHQLIGTLIRFNRIEKPLLWSNFIFNQYNQTINKNSYTCSEDITKNDIQLSEREQKVLFLLSLNYNTRQIADIISKSEAKTVTPNLIRNNINQQLYVKFGVNTVTELLEKYSMLESEKIIPASFDKQFATTIKCKTIN